MKYLFWVIPFLMVSCNEGEPKDAKEDGITEKEVNFSLPDLAPKGLYVVVPAGVTMRSAADPNSAPVAIIPYGAEVEKENDRDSTIIADAVKGTPLSVVHDGRAGYIYDGFLSKYPPPAPGADPATYWQNLARSYNQIVMDTMSSGSGKVQERAQRIKVPEATWPYAFFTARELYGIPREFRLPEAKGKKKETIAQSALPPDVDSGKLEISRPDGTLRQISFSKNYKEGGTLLLLTRTAEDMIIEYRQVQE